MDGKHPDALIIPDGRRSGSRMSERVASICDIAEPLLGVDRAAGARAWIRVQPGGRLFITKDPADTLGFPTVHDRAGQPRYRWERQPDGIEYGYLVEDA